MAQIWVDTGDRRNVTDAANRIDHELGHDPDTKGYSDAMGVRVLRISPIEVAFVVHSADRVVRVTHVQREP